MPFKSVHYENTENRAQEWQGEMTGQVICRFLALTDFASQHCGERCGLKNRNELSTESGDKPVRNSVRGRKKK
ncbi:MAG: hypothetical protein VB135_02855, partial [Burkholderia sp.]